MSRRYQDILVQRLLAATLDPDLSIDMVELQSKLTINNRGKNVAKQLTNEVTKVIDLV